MKPADGLVVTHTSTVTSDQIDHLGHMNVRFYGANACAATRSFVGPGEIYDLYTRHHREQLLGVELEVRSGLLSVDRDSTQVYHELIDSATGDIGATFVHRVRSPTPADHADTVEIPERGRPRSLDLDDVIATPTLDEVQHLDLAIRAPRTVAADDSGGDEIVPADAIQMLFWGGEPVDGNEQQLVYTGPNGESMGWATMETRIVIDRAPTVGTPIQSFSAPTAIADKTTQMTIWLFDLHTGELLASFEAVSVLFDIGARRATSIPEAMRADLVAGLRSEFRSRSPEL